MRRLISILAATALVALFISQTACVYVYGPPIRSPNYGAPGRVAPDEIEVQGAMSFHRQVFDNFFSGGGMVGAVIRIGPSTSRPLRHWWNR